MEINRSTLIFFAVLIASLAFSSGYFFSKTNSTSAPAPTVTTQTAQPQAQAPAAQVTVSKEMITSLFSKNLITFGDATRKLLIVEMSDPSCPYCHVAGGINLDIGPKIGSQFAAKSQGGTYEAPVPEIKKLVDQKKASFVWIYYPGHGNGEMGAKALYCAYDQGKFWEAQDLLMSSKGYDLMNVTIKNDKTQSKALAAFLKSAVNPTELQSCLDSGKYDARLQTESSLSVTLGIKGTPDFYLNTSNFNGAYSWPEMKTVADAALNN